MNEKEKRELSAVTFAVHTARGEDTWQDYLRALEENLDFWLDRSETWR